MLRPATALTCIIASLITISGLYLRPAAAAGDRREVSAPQQIQPVCTTLYPQSGEAVTMTQQRIQQALDHCPAGQALRLSTGAAGNTFLSGPLTIPAGVFLRLSAGSVLKADTDPQRYDTGQGRCGTIDNRGTGCRPFITLRSSNGGGIQGKGIIDGQGGSLMAGHKETWWQLARRAQSVAGGKQNVPRLLQITGSQNIIVSGIRLRNAPGFHIVLSHVQGATLWGIIIDTPASARNTDGIDPAASEDITVSHSFIRTGDDNIAIKAGNGPSEHISVIDNHFYSGHGMSIGSEVNAGVRDVVIHNLTLDGTTSGLRIKSDASRGGLVSDIDYSDICMRNNRWPVSFDSRYNPAATGDKIPDYRHIMLSNINAEGAGKGTVVLRGYDAQHPLQVTIDAVTFSPDTQWSVVFTRLTTGKQGISPPPARISLRMPLSPPAPQPECSAKWRPFPAV
ncbi:MULTISPECIES: glycosyl hydrolase family 28 protein [Tatumella]|uniref:Glycoside hydrolase family 28 protein n=1 Tax=Tatumella punctata TaxID=399969 RepID=A0ABW1VKW8_9GAMM|nr:MULTISPECIES: glycosyl hydrolase family 28 protein [unclassified Tatumella]MBS0855454.1 endo-polygalacturonase [Tatumella sp. JGM16]MBS0877174.1 endo-polygalacturonase [Tatumella sp. JGM82]MBS0889457.1 endo-polygalacturonase [Tatumella sp. JGM94]MBS0895019.1 endo-polygalacturonase [Tatumella sp. JGM130]MBS0901571.1 endo-polygalacturonase [Tatumella sp. JGM100]